MCKFVLGLLTKKCKLFLGRDTVMGNLTMTTKYKIFNIDYHGKNVPYRYISDILLNKVLIISDLILGK